MDEACNANEELEEGECSDQDDLGMSNENTDLPKQPMNHSGVGITTIYRRDTIPQIIISSDQSDGDSDDDYDGYPAHGKKTRRFSDPYSEPSTFVNPLRSSLRNEESFSDQMGRKRRNNVWGAVMTEQMLSQNIKHFGVNAPFAGGNRDVESYDFTVAKEDDRPEVDIKTDNNEKEDIFGGVVDLEREVTKHQNRKRKRNVKDRLGPRIVGHDNRNLQKIYVTESDDIEKVTKAITDCLSEQNIPLFTRIVEAVGSEKAIQLYNMTVDVEDAGGMMINSGNRRRTPGGVYIQLLKSESSIPDAILSTVFEQEEQKWHERKKELRKIKKAARKKSKRKTKRLEMDLDRPETPTPTEELEELDNANEVEVDVSDLPDRPDTPEPKDCSDNESEVEEDEEEDIAVAIAKAKAAILKKQKELCESECKIEEDENSGVISDNVEMS